MCAIRSSPFPPSFHMFFFLHFHGSLKGCLMPQSDYWRSCCHPLGGFFFRLLCALGFLFTLDLFSSLFACCHSRVGSLFVFLPVSWSLIEILSHDQGGRSHEIALRMRQVIVLKPVVVSDIIQIPILHIIIRGMGSHSWQGGHVISCLLGHVIESQSNFNLQVSLV